MSPFLRGIGEELHNSLIKWWRWRELNPPTAHFLGGIKWREFVTVVKVEGDLLENCQTKGAWGEFHPIPRGERHPVLPGVEVGCGPA
jgi:hypothetical protein